MKKMITRRNFLKAAGVSAAGSGCLRRLFQQHRFLCCQFYRCFQHRCKGRRQGLLPELQARAGSGLAGSGR